MVTQIASLDEFNAFFHQPTLHPLVGLGRLEDAELSLFSPIDFGMYCIVLMDEDFGELKKAGNGVHYKAGTAFSIRPGQVVSMNLDLKVTPRGYIMAFRPELLIKAGLGRDFYMFSFFNQDTLEAVQLSEEERRLLIRAYQTLLFELQTPSDNLTDHMLRLSIGHLLSYYKRFFDRQFSSESLATSDLIRRLNSILDEYLSSGQPIQKGQPTVAWCADQFHLSPNYFGELVRRQLQITAQEYIQNKVIETAKDMLKDSNLSINDIAKSLGFNYPNHFTRLFHKKVGISPTLFRKERM